MNHEYKVGDYAIAVESQWVGKIREIKTYTTVIDHDMPPVDETLVEMIGVNILAMDLTGWQPDECLDVNDIQCFDVNDLQPWEGNQRERVPAQD